MSRIDKVWSGKRQIVFGIDIGTTQSAVTYAYLYPGGNPVPRRVARWPGHETQRGETKIPSIVWYDRQNRACSFGAEAELLETEDVADEEGWELARHFKLHLHPESIRTKYDITVEPLPSGISVEQVYADFMGYLIRHTESFFKESTIDGLSVWNELRSSAVFVISHPNGWETKEQAVLQRAAVSAGLISYLDEAEDRIMFVSEAEASVHFVLSKSDVERNFQSGTDFVVCDAGGSTVDITLYTVDTLEPQLGLKEKKASICVQAGAIFVNEFARLHFLSIFTKPSLAGEEGKSFIANALTSFENDAKKSFGDVSESKSILVGMHKFSDSSLGIKRGRITLSGKDIARFFSPCVSQIISNLKKQLDGQDVKYIFLVGGFGDSPYLRSRVQVELGSSTLQVISSNDSAAKAVSDGAIQWFVKRTVIARAARYTFGLHLGFDATEEQAKNFKRPLQMFNSGDIIYGHFEPIVKKDDVIPESAERVRPFRVDYEVVSRPKLTTFAVPLYVSDSIGRTWIFDKDVHVSQDRDGADTIVTGTILPGFREICKVTTDISHLVNIMQSIEGKHAIYWRLDFRMVLRFGSTSIKAYLVWDEDGVEKRGPATVIPPEFV